MNRERYTFNEMAEALKASHGNAAAAARSLGCDWKTVRRYILRYPELAKVRRAARVARTQSVTLEDRAAYWRAQFRVNEGNGTLRG